MTFSPRIGPSLFMKISLAEEFYKTTIQQSVRLSYDAPSSSKLKLKSNESIQKDRHKLVSTHSPSECNLHLPWLKSPLMCVRSTNHNLSNRFRIKYYWKFRLWMSMSYIKLGFSSILWSENFFFAEIDSKLLESNISGQSSQSNADV